MKLAGKVAIVTGAGNGIGEASALLFAEEGASVLCADLSGADAERTADKICEAGGKAEPCQVDVRSFADSERMVAAALERFGGLDILFNNAGTGVRKPVHETSEEEWDLVLDTNLKSVFLGSKAALPHFMAQGSGNIISTASTFGLLAAASYPGYCASKAGVILLTKQMALDYGPA